MIQSRAYLVLVLVVAGTGCDPNAKTNANERAFLSEERLSREHESCASSLDCAGELRCLEQVCRSTQASLIGEYHAAAGARHLEAGDAAKAAEAFTAAVNRYESDNVLVPPALYCARGRALVALRQQDNNGELAARALHRCLRAAPVGSGLRVQALASLAVLGDMGLDPELLARDKDMDKYLTGQPARPALDSVKVEISGKSSSRSRSYTDFLALLQSADTRAPLVACWEANWKATRQKTMTVTLPLQYRFIEAEFAENDRDKLSVAGDEPAAGSPERCVRDVVAPLAENYSKGKQTGTRWDAEITVAIGQ